MSEPIRILHVLGGLNRGGAETMIMNIYRHIDCSKIQFDFVIHTKNKCDYSDEITELGGRIFNVPRYNGKNHFSYKKAWENFFTIHPEYKIVHGHMRSTAGVYLKIAKKYGLITIAHSHSTSSRGNTIEQIVKNIMQYPIRYIADYLFACSDEAGKWLFGKNVVKKDNYRVIKNAIDVEKYTFNAVKRNEMRKALCIEYKFVVGHVGNFTYPKNHKFLIDIFYQFQKQKENSVLLLVGDGELRPQIEKQISDLKIKDKVILTGVVQNVNDYMQAMDVFVFPSIFEGLGMVVVEAQTSGLPCIVSDIVSREVCITHLVKLESTKKLCKIWSNDIFQFCENKVRFFMGDDVKKSGYDITQMIKEMELLYFRINKNESIKGCVK